MSIARSQDHAAPSRGGKTLGDSDPVTIGKVDVKQHGIWSHLLDTREASRGVVCLSNDVEASSRQQGPRRLAK